MQTTLSNTRKTASRKEKRKATTGFEPMIKVLQTSALPLGDAADLTTVQEKKLYKKNGAEDEIRTRDLLLGKETF